MPVKSSVWHGQPCIGQVPRGPHRPNLRRIWWSTGNSSFHNIQPMGSVVCGRCCGTARVSWAIETRCIRPYASSARLYHQRSTTSRPRLQCRRNRMTESNARWTMDVTHLPCGQDGWGHLTAVMDCHDREMIGYVFAWRGRAQEAERVIETACLTRFGTLRPLAPPVL